MCCEPVTREVVLRGVIESDEDSHKTRGSGGTSWALYGLRVW